MKVVRGRVRGKVVQQVSEGKGCEQDGQACYDVQDSHGTASLTQMVKRCKCAGARDEPGLPAFTKFADASRIEVRFRKLYETNPSTGAFMPASGELIRSMNYVEDITTTLRRICISIPAMNAEERKRLADSLRTAGGALNSAIADLEKAEK